MCIRDRSVLRDSGYGDIEALRWLFTPDDSLGGTLGRSKHEFLAGIIQEIDEARVGLRYLDRYFCDDIQHVLDIESRADGLTEFPQRLDLDLLLRQCFFKAVDLIFCLFNFIHGTNLY